MSSSAKKVKTLLALVIMVFTSCQEPAPTETPRKITGLDFAERLKSWSMQQPEPFVIAFLGDTTTGSMGFEGNLVSNIISEWLGGWQFHDSLFVDTSNARYFDRTFESETLAQLFDKISEQQTEEQMTSFLKPLGFKLRMMYYNSITLTLADSLVRWSNAQFPPPSYTYRLLHANL